MLVYLAALWQLLVNMVYTRCGRLLEMSGLLCGSFFYRNCWYLDVLILFCLMLYCTFGVCFMCFYVFYASATFWCNK